MITDEDLEFISADGTDCQLEIKEMATELLQHRDFKRTPCRWEQDMDGNWETGCGNLFSFIEGGPKENDTNFCQYCGHKIEEHEYD